MKKVIILSSILLLFLSACTDKKSKDNYIRSFRLCNNFIVEKYNVYSGGVYGGGIYSNYLTDSTNFEIFIGTYDDNCYYDYLCYKNKILVLTNCINGFDYDVVDVEVYDTLQLINMKNLKIK